MENSKITMGINESLKELAKQGLISIDEYLSIKGMTQSEQIKILKQIIDHETSRDTDTLIKPE